MSQNLEKSRTSQQPSPTTVVPERAVKRSPKGEGLRRHFLILRYNVTTAITSKNWWSRAALAVITMLALSAPVFASVSVRAGLLHFSGQLCILFYKAWTQSAPQNLALIERSSNKRRLALYKIVKRLNQWPTLSSREAKEYQQDVLALIASYARDHRADFEGTKVFVNLLVERGDFMEVVARDNDHRLPGNRVPKVHSIAWESMTSGTEAHTGSLYLDYPDTEKGKKYQSVLALPVRYGDAIVGVLTIDSERAYHFDGEVKNLVTLVMPYVALLGWTLRNEERAS